VPTVGLTTFKDAIDHGVDFMGATVSNEAARDARRAVLAALREIANIHRWSYYYQRGRIGTSAQQTTGTIDYDHTGGTHERQVTLASGTWPDWAAFGVLVISNVAYEIADKKTSTVITLSSTSNPGADVAAGTSYILYRDTYPLPSDFVAGDEVMSLGSMLTLTFQHPRAWLQRQRIIQSPAAPHVYTVMGDQNYFGSLALKLSPPPDQAYQLDFLYQRRPRLLVLDEYSTGTVTATADATTLAGTGTTWTSSMVGSVVRLSDDATNKPTGLVGAEPPAAERVVMGFTSATSLTVDTAWSSTLTGVKHLISDPLDIEEGTMLTAFWRCVEKELGIIRKMKDRDLLIQLYKDALILAMEADSRSFRSGADVS
jgi:hypothetical protein